MVESIFVKPGVGGEGEVASVFVSLGGMGMLCTNIS